MTYRTAIKTVGWRQRWTLLWSLWH